MFVASVLLLLTTQLVFGFSSNSTRRDQPTSRVNEAKSSERQPLGGMLKIEHMNELSLTGSIINYTRNNSTIFSGSVPYPPSEGTWGELVPFYPLDACTALRESNYTRRVGGSLRLSTMGPFPNVVALVARGNCSFEEKFENIADVPNIVGVVMIDSPTGGTLSNEIELSADKAHTPGFMIDNRTGMRLLQKIHEYRQDERQFLPTKWIRVTMKYMNDDGVVNALQFGLLVVVLLLLVAFASSVIIHYHIYRMQVRLNEDQQSRARDAIIIDNEFLEKIPKVKYHSADGTNDAAGTGQSQEESKHPNDTCPICIEEFIHEELLNQLGCGHYYHIDCIRPWLQTRSPCCPLCKEDVRSSMVGQNAAIKMPKMAKFVKSVLNRLNPHVNTSHSHSTSHSQMITTSNIPV